MDDYVRNLIEEMEKSCKMAQEAAVLREHSLRFDEIVGKILLQVIECTHFVKSYCGQSSFREYPKSCCRDTVMPTARLASQVLRGLPVPRSKCRATLLACGHCAVAC